MKKFLNMLSLLFLMILLPHASLLSDPPPPQWQPFYPQDSQRILMIIENLLNALQSKEFTKAYQLFTTRNFREQTSEQDFTFFVSSYPIMMNAKNAFFGNLESVDPKMGIVRIQGSLSSTEGNNLRLEFYLQRLGDDWRIEGIQVLKEPQQ